MVNLIFTINEMKKLFALMLVLAGSLCVLSCSKDEEPENLTVEKQQMLIEQSIIDFTNMVQASDFEEMAGFLNEMVEIAKSVDMKELGKLDSIAKSVRETLMDDSMEVHTELIPVKLYEPVDKGAKSVIKSDTVYTTERLYKLSNFKGHFTQTDSMTWIYTEAKDFQMIFKDSMNNECVFKLERQGKETQFKAPDYIDDEDYNRSQKDETVYYEKVVDICRESVSIPEKIIVSLAKNKKNVISFTIKTNLSKLVDGYFDIASSKIGIETILECNNGYKFTSKNEYEGNKSVSTSFSMKKSDKNAFSFNLSANPEGIPVFELNDDDQAKHLMDSLRHNIDTINGKKLYISGSLMNGMKVVGTVSDIKKVIELEDSIHKVVTSEVKFKSIVDELNKSINLYLCFGGSDKKQVRLVTEPVCERSYDGQKYSEEWSRESVLVLADGSKASVAEYLDVEQYEVGIVAIVRMGVQYYRLVTTGQARDVENKINMAVRSVFKMLTSGGKVSDLVDEFDKYKDKVK